MVACSVAFGRTEVITKSCEKGDEPAPKKEQYLHVAIICARVTKDRLRRVQEAFKCSNLSRTYVRNEIVRYN